MGVHAQPVLLARIRTQRETETVSLARPTRRRRPQARRCRHASVMKDIPARTVDRAVLVKQVLSSLRPDPPPAPTVRITLRPTPRPRHRPRVRLLQVIT